MSPFAAASAGGSTVSSCSRAFATDAESGRRPTITLTPESRRLSACAWPWLPYPMMDTVLPSRLRRSASSS